MTRRVTLAPVTPPDFGVPEDRPDIPAHEYRERQDALRRAAPGQWIVVYGDREHFANLTYLCGFDPRFEEALLLLEPEGPTRLVVGLEGEAYASLLSCELEVVVCPSLSLMGQSRAGGPTLEAVLSGAGIRSGRRVAVVGWKALTTVEWTLPFPAIAAPALLVDLLRHLTGEPNSVSDATLLLMDAAEGLRASSSPAQIAAFEWAAARASRCVADILAAARPGVTERDAVGEMPYHGEPLSVHVMFASGPEVAVGLRGPAGRALEAGDAATTAVGFWGGLSCRAGLIDRRPGNGESHAREYLERMALPYWDAIATWYETVRLGVPGSAVNRAVAEALADAEFTPALNPGHLIHLDEWVDSPISPASEVTLKSGMTLQCDIIPSSARPGWAANCEDGVALADAALRDSLAREHPEAWARITARQAYMRRELGIELADEVLPLSSIPAWFPPFWLSPEYVIRRT